MKTIDVLKGARNLLAQPDVWIRGKYTADKNGAGVAIGSGLGAKFCAVGALIKVHGSDNTLVFEKELQATLKLHEYEGCVEDFNDKQKTVKPVLDLFDETIARLEAES